MAFLLLAWLLGEALAAPTPVAVSSQDEALLARGEVVIHPAADAGGWTEALVDVQAPPARVLDAVLDFPARTREVGGLKGATVYLQQGDRAGVRWEMSIAGISAAFHTLYQTDRAGLFTEYLLDTSRPNDLLAAEGSYQVLPLPGGSSRLVYRARAQGHRAVPAWLRDTLAQRSARAMLAGMRDRAQAGGAP